MAEKRELTEEQKAARREALNRGRETAARNRAAKAQAAPASPQSQPDPDFAPQIIAPGGTFAGVVDETEDDEPTGEDVPASAYDKFLATLDDETRELLTEADLREIFDAQVLKAAAEKKAQAKKSVTERALHAARVSEGLIPPASAEALRLLRHNNEMVTFTVDLPEMGDIGLRIDQEILLHGYTYTRTRAQYDSIRDTVYRAQRQELAFEGKDRRNWLWRRGRDMIGNHLDFDA